MRVKWGKRPLSRVAVALTAAAVAVSVSGASCGDDDVTTTPARIERPPPTFRLLVMTDIKGYLEPCGCTSRPLGGIDRTAAKVAELRAQGQPVLLVAAGDLFFDGVSYDVHGAEAQEIWKAETLVEVLDGIEVAAVTPGRLDFSHGTATFRALAREASFPLLAAGVSIAPATAGGAPEPEPAPGTDREGETPGAEPDAPTALPAHVIREVAGVRVGIFGVSDLAGPDGALPEGVERTAEMRAAARDAATALRGDGAELLIALVRGTRRDARQIAQSVDGLAFVVQSGLDLEEAIPPFEVNGAWVLHAGRQGQGLVVVNVYRRGEGTFTDWSDWTRAEQRTHAEGRIRDLRARIAEWEEDDSVPEADVERQRARLAQMERELESLTVPRSVEGNAFAARYEALPPEAPKSAEVSRLMQRHFRRVNQHNRQVFADLTPPPLPEAQPGFAGSAACRSCHEAEHAWWLTTKHGRAYATLVERHKQFNLSCVGCHVTGYMDPGGATVTHLGDSGVLRDVGCESCHGPSSLHVEDPEVGLLLDPPEGLCIECHNPEHSDTFNYTAYRAMMLAPGHGMPLPGETP